ncbi:MULTISPECIES: hypothetical protein [unclassified Streptomyces]|uniref:hypothetical protein n=1 Tax=unclassified Streptomyces TaxID=2593676 RepID=UPI00081D73C0|nr:MULTISPECIES: hypothetical protein [unclassified Streptomyces]MYZ36000.1 hypothetical protein [Streptomyces sp. SID4917]SCF80136.1 hypothetical protein GA0115259_102808 [Streptomyces sp. MnatMP-M17]
MGRFEERRFEKRCARRLADMPLPVPFSVDALIANIEAVRGRRIRLLPVSDRDTDLRTACGLRVQTGEWTIICYRRRPTYNQTLHTILHEIGHEWLGHGTTLTAEETARYVPAVIGDELLRPLGGNAVVQARARYDTEEEREAELSASLIKRAARQQALPGTDMVSLLEASLSSPTVPFRRGRM